MAMQVGKLHSFNSQTTSIIAYLEQVELYFWANKIDECLRTPVLLTTVGSSNYEVLRNLIATKSYDEIVSALTSHQSRSSLPNVSTSRCDQQTTESVAVYIDELRQLSLHSRFDVYLDQALRDRLVCGLRNESTKAKFAGGSRSQSG